MRVLLAILLSLLCPAALAGSIVLIPLDNRPASGQYSEIIARIGGAKVLTPPMRMLGNYTISGSPDSILKWLSEQDLSDCEAMVVSTDMICYGSLFESRKNAATASEAKARLQKLMQIRAKAPSAKLYLYSSIMRLTPSATHDQGSYRLALARYVELRSRGVDKAGQEGLRKQIPKGALEEYDAARARNHAFQKHLVSLAATKAVDLVIFGQDDASLYGPHVGERKALAAQIDALQVGAKARFCEGIDQIPSLLASRALLASGEFRPSVRVVYSDPEGAKKVAAFETQPLEKTVEDQIVVSGARVSPSGADYTLYVNTPDRRHAQFRAFLDSLQRAVDANEPVSVADVNLSRSSASPDPELYAALTSPGRPLKLLAYSAWNTAANTLGTSVAAANLYLMSKSKSGDPVAYELAHKQFLLMRMANDYAYHTFTRPVAFQMTEGPRQEAIFGKDFYEVNDFVQRDLSKFLKKTFYDNFLGRTFKAGGKEYEFIGMTDLVVGLPWPRPYEVRLDFELQARERL